MKTMFINSEVLLQDFHTSSVLDKKGNKIGWYVLIVKDTHREVSEVEYLEDEHLCNNHLESLTIFKVSVQKTRNGEKFGAIQSDKRFYEYEKSLAFGMKKLKANFKKIGEELK